MISEAFGLIYTSESGANLKEITYSRSAAAVPVGGRYRAIDFMMSNLVNTGIRNIGIIVQKNYHSLMDHLGPGKEWDLHRKRDGLFILPPFVTRENTGTYRGSLDALRSVLGYIRRSQQKYCIFAGNHTIYNSRFDDAIRFHKEKNADITVLYNEEETLPGPEDMEAGERLYMSVNEDGRVTDLAQNPVHPRVKNLGMETYIIGKELLVYLIEECNARFQYDFTRDVLFARLNELRIYGCRYDGFVGRLYSIMDYFRLNMRLLEKEVREDLFFRGGSIYTKIKDEVPVRYGKNARAENCIMADGCIIEGEVENSVLFRGVSIAPGAVVKNSIIMQGSVIGKGAQLEYAILDKNVRVSNGKRIIGQESFPVLIRKNTLI